MIQPAACSIPFRFRWTQKGNRMKTQEPIGRANQSTVEFGYIIHPRTGPKMANIRGWMIYPVDDITEFYCS